MDQRKAENSSPSNSPTQESIVQCPTKLPNEEPIVQCRSKLPNEESVDKRRSKSPTEELIYKSIDIFLRNGKFDALVESIREMNPETEEELEEMVYFIYDRAVEGESFFVSKFLG